MNLHEYTLITYISMQFNSKDDGTKRLIDHRLSFERKGRLLTSLSLGILTPLLKVRAK